MMGAIFLEIIGPEKPGRSAQIPLKKPNFYRQVFDALYEWHDLTKDGYSTREKTCKLDIDGFHKILRGLGFISVMKGRVEADTDEILGWIRQAKTYAPELKFSESDFLEDAIRAVPVLRREGNAVMWSHKSLAEYFFAQFIVTDAKLDQARICQSIASSLNLPAYRNAIDLLYDMDFVLFSQYFVTPLLNLFDAEMQRLKAVLPAVPRDQLELRAAVTFGRRAFVLGDPSAKHMSKKMEERIAEISHAGMREWYGLDAEHDEVQILDARLLIEFGHGAGMGSKGAHSQRLVFLSHAIRIIFSVLIAKKHALVLQRALYPPALQKGDILGIRNGLGLPINESPAAVWNSQKNFAHTTAALARQTLGIVNLSRIPSIRHEIEQMSGKSQTTASLLASLEAA